MNSEVSRIFNSTIVAAAVSAAFELGLLNTLKDDEYLDINAYCEQHHLHQQSVTAMCVALSCFGIVTLDEQRNVVQPGELFEETFLQKGYFLWLIRGYGGLWQNLGDLVQKKNRPEDSKDRSFIPRNGEYIARAGRDYGASFVDHHFERLIHTEPFHVVADLGCGSAARLINLISQHPTLSGVGVDIDARAVAVARKAVSESHAEGRIRIVQGDVGRLDPLSEFCEVEILLCFFMGHDLWPRETCQQFLQGLLVAFPRVKRFLFCDTYRSELMSSSELGSFTLGFEVSHAVMGQYIPSRSEWLSLFADSGWHCVKEHPVDIPFSAIFDLRPTVKQESRTFPA